MRYLLHFTCVALVLGVLCWCTPIEDKLQTEIFLKDPTEFHEGHFVLLWGRQLGFDRLRYNISGQVVDGRLGQWDSVIYAFRYQFAYRDRNLICPNDWPRGIATYTDWSLMVPCLFTSRPEVCPRTFYVHTLMFAHFVGNTLPNMDPSCRFILITAGCDYTIPSGIYNTNKNLIPGLHNSGPDSYWMKVLNDERVVHWFAENHDMNHPKVSTLPTGMYVPQSQAFIEDWSNYRYLDGNASTPILQRPLKMFMSDRVRDGQGFLADRAWAKDQCRKSPLCDTPENVKDAGMDHAQFVAKVASYPFITCVHGGGMDPSPKAFEAILIGTIPIIQHSTLDDGYDRLPVMFVHDWKEIFNNNTESLLRSWLTKLAPYYEENSYLRKETLERLKSSYWLEQFHQKLNDYEVKRIRSVTHHNHSHYHNHVLVNDTTDGW